MDIGTKIFSSIICRQSFKIINAHGAKYQFGYTPVLGCQDVRFTLNTLIHLQNKHNLPISVAFTDLVKYFDTPNHLLMISILAKYGSPARFCSVFKVMYRNSLVRLIIRIIVTSIPFKVEVNQRDIMDPVLFLFLIMAFDEMLEKECPKIGLTKATFSIQRKSPLSTVKIVSHIPESFTLGTLSKLFYMIYVDDGVFVFESIKYPEKGQFLIFSHFSIFGLEMHIGRGLKPSKTD